jgi:hypothetical protein
MRLAIPVWSGQVFTFFDFAHYLLWVGLGNCTSLCQGVDSGSGGIGQRDVFFWWWPLVNCYSECVNRTYGYKSIMERREYNATW